MSYYSHTSLYSAASPPISTDAWGLIRLGTSTVSASTIAGSGITGSHYITTGRHGFSFSNPERYGGGGYVVLATPEAKGPFDSTNTNRNVFYTPVWRNTTSSTIPGSTAPGITGGLRVHSVSFDTPAGASGHTAGLYDFTVSGVNSVEAHIGVAAFAFKRSNDMYSTTVQNLINTDMKNGWLRSTATAEIDGEPGPIGYPSYKVTPSSGYLYSNPAISIPTGAASVKTYTASLYAKSGTTSSVRMLLGTLNETSSRYLFTVNLNGATGTATGSSISGPGISSVTTNTGTNNTVAVSDAGNGWRKIVITHRPTTPNNGNLYFYLDTGTVSSTTFFYASAPQVEEGSIATTFVPTGTAAPVKGNQDERKQFVPGGVGFGVTGATHHSHMPAMLSTRSVTAYGTIVIPGIKGNASNPCAYIENGYNVLHGVSAGANSEFDVSFVKSMNTANYCVILSGEVTPPADSPDYADLDEFSILMVDRRKKDTTGFRAVSLQQYSVDNKWYRSSTWYQKGYTRKIHFLVFGGGTYGQP